MLLAPSAVAFRLLVPELHIATVREELSHARYVVCSRGPGVGGIDSLEVMFEDHSSAPFSVQLSPEQVVPGLPPDPAKSGDKLEVLGPGLVKLGTLRAKHRRVRHLPYLQPWK